MFEITPQDWDVALKLFMATFLGAVIGFEREKKGKAAGLRTHAMVCLGSALVMIISTEIFDLYKDVASVDPSRIAAQVVTGIGFLGAGAIIRSTERVKGLTTAAGIWTASGIGLACGIGQYRPAIITTALAMLILVVFLKVDRMIGNEDH